MGNYEAHSCTPITVTPPVNTDPAPAVGKTCENGAVVVADGALPVFGSHRALASLSIDRKADSSPVGLDAFPVQSATTQVPQVFDPYGNPVQSAPAITHCEVKLHYATQTLISCGNARCGAGTQYGGWQAIVVSYDIIATPLLTAEADCIDRLNSPAPRSQREREWWNLLMAQPSATRKVPLYGSLEEMRAGTANWSFNLPNQAHPPTQSCMMACGDTRIPGVSECSGLREVPGAL